MSQDATGRLIEGALQGDQGQRAALLDRLRPRIVLWAASRMSPALRARIEPEDLAQEILLAVHQGFDGFEGNETRAFLGWAFRIGENRIRDAAAYFGAAKRQPRPPPVTESQTSPGARVAREEAVARVQGAIERLSGDHRDVIRLRRLEERPTSEVAELMGRSETAVRILYCRALKALRAGLPEEL